MDLTFQWIGGATAIIALVDLKIAIDPVLCPKGTIQDYFWFKSKRIEKPIYKKEDFDTIDLWLLTHNHEDHLDELGLEMINNPTYVVSNQNTVKKLAQKELGQHAVLKCGEKKKYQIKTYTIEVEAIPAIHGVNPVSAFFAGKVNGYLVTITKDNESKTIYFTSDTVYKKRVINKLKNRKIDLLVPNMGAAKQGSWIMTLTLNAKMLQKMIAKLNPKIVIPVHYGTFEHYKEPVEKIREIADERVRIVAVGSKTKIIL